MRIIAGSAKGRKLITPRSRSIRPALDRIRESVFSILGDRVESTRILDLFAGTGACGLEALSRGAKHALFVDSSEESLDIVRKNVENLGFARQSTVLEGDALVLPEAKNLDRGSLGIIFMDPPFDGFRQARTALRLFARAAELLVAPAASDEAVLVLRFPSGYRDPLPFSGNELRQYGESAVAFLEKSHLGPEFRA